MRLSLRAVWLLAWVAIAMGSPAQAAWNNVFQVCCHNCQKPPTVAYYQDAAPIVAPPQNCTTRYVQRSYYQPVTTYENRNYMEQVTTYRTSYYWEPVTGYRVSSYYDPGTCSYQQCSQPVTSYRLRSQCCPVQSWVSRCVTVPVTSQQLVTYYEPQTTCCSTTIGAPVMTLPPGTTAVPFESTAPPLPAPPSGGAGVQEYRQPAGDPGMGSMGNNGASRLKPQALGPNNPTGVRPAAPPASPRTTIPSSPPPVRLDRITNGPRPNVEGEIVRSDDSAEPGARLIFRRANRQQETEAVRSDNRGRFRASLASGTWDIYVQHADGKLTPKTRIEVPESGISQIRLTSR